MKGIVFLLALLVALSQSTMAGAAAPSNAPDEVLAAETAEEVRLQTGRVIYSTWDGEEFDRSFPPIKWPVSMPVTSDSETSISIATQEPPADVEIRVWHRVRPNGIPKGKPKLITCEPSLLPTDAACTLEPQVGPDGISWRATFDLPWKDGYRYDHHYLAILANWEAAQVVWINHIMRSYYTAEGR